MKTIETPSTLAPAAAVEIARRWLEHTRASGAGFTNRAWLIVDSSGSVRAWVAKVTTISARSGEARTPRPAGLRGDVLVCLESFNAWTRAGITWRAVQ